MTGTLTTLYDLSELVFSGAEPNNLFCPSSNDYSTEMNMRRPALVALCAACALAVGIPASLGLSADSADDRASRPLSQVPKVERFGQAALDAQSAFLKRMPGIEIRYGENG